MKLLTFSLLCLFLLQCQKFPEPNNPCPPNGDCHFDIFESSELALTENQGFISLRTDPGGKLVFCYQFQKEDQPNLADDEYKEELFWEIPEDIDSFEFVDEELSNAKTTFGRLCFCADGGYHRVNKGVLKGTKIGNKQWEISCNLEIETKRGGNMIGQYPKSMQAIFSVK